MIAYNHYIKFIPELKNNKKMEGTYSNIITVQENATFNLDDKLLYELTFFNNQGRDLSLYTDREFARTQENQFWAFEVKGVVTFFWHSETLVLEYIRHEYFTDKLLEYWCLHIVLPVFFTIEESYYFLHAGAVEIENKPVLFVAESFGGKSTMTDFFMKQGHTMISDDKVATYEKNGQSQAVSSHQHHRPYRKMEDLGFFVEKFSFKVKPIHVIYELEKSNAGAKVEILEINGVEKFKLLNYSSQMNFIFQKQKNFKILMRMVNMIAIYKVIVPWDMGRLSEVYDVICKHSEGIK